MSFDRDLFLPVSRDDMAHRGWDEEDAVSGIFQFFFRLVDFYHLPSDNRFHGI